MSQTAWRTENKESKSPSPEAKLCTAPGTWGKIIKPRETENRIGYRAGKTEREREDQGIPFNDSKVTAMQDEYILETWGQPSTNSLQYSSVHFKTC